MAAIIIKGSLPAAKDGDVAFKTLQLRSKSGNFTAGTIEVLIIP